MSAYAYKGKGEAFARLKGTTDPLRKIGNAGAVTLNTATNNVDLIDNTRVGGALDERITTISEVTLTATLYNLSPENLAMVFGSDLTEVLAGAVTGETHAAQVGGLVQTTYIPDAAAALTVTGSVLYTEGTHYDRRASGIFVKDIGSGGIEEGETLTFAYTKDVVSVLELFSTASGEYELVFEGLNEAKSGRPFVLNMHRATWGTPESFELIQEDAFAGLEVTATLLADPDIVEAGLSPYVTAREVRA